MAQILSAIHRMSHAYHTHVNIDGLFEALGGGAWRRIDNIERDDVGRDLS